MRGSTALFIIFVIEVDAHETLRSSCGFATGSGFQKTPLIWLKIALLAPTPSAGVTTAMVRIPLP